MFNVGDLVRFAFSVFMTTFPIMPCADRRSSQVTGPFAVSPQCLFTHEYCIVAVGTVNKSVSLKVIQFIWIILWLFILQRCLAPAWRAGRGGWWSISGATWHRSAVDRVTELTWGRGTVTMEAPVSTKQTLVDSA